MVVSIPLDTKQKERNMRILFAAPEGRTAQLKSVGVEGIFTSYLAWRGRTFDPTVREFDFVFVDSGAHLYVKPKGAGRPSKSELNLPKPDEYVDEYITFLKENWEAFDYFAELDIGHSMVFNPKKNPKSKAGAKWVKATRQKFIDAGLKEKLVPVYHDEYMTLAELEELCKEYSYIGIGQMSAVNMYRQPFEIGKKYETKFHGFSMTKEDFMKKLPFYSVDSTSWLAGSRYGSTYYFKGAKLIQTAEKAIRRTMKGKLDKIGIDWEKVMADDPYEVDRMNAHAWIEYNRHINKFDKSYWRKGLVPTDVIELTEEGELPKRYNPADNLPEATRGKIMEIRTERPEVEEKRLDRHQRAMVQNTFAWKNGKYSQYRAVPEYINEYMEDLEYLDFNDPEQVKASLYTLLRQNMKRIALGQFFEMADGGVQDKNLSKLTVDTMALLKDIGGLGAPPAGTLPAGTQNNTQINIGDTKGLTEDERLTARAAIGEALNRIGHKTQE
jgi:hypothetical protein